MATPSTSLPDSEERDNFFRLTLLMFRLGNTKLREDLKSQWPSVYLNANPGSTPTPWSDTPPDAVALKRVCKLKFQFKNQEKKFNSGNTNEWDFSLLSLVLLSTPYRSVLGSAKTKALKELKEIRNNLIGHAPDARISNTSFKPEWTNACKALEKFNATQDEFDAVEKDIEKPVDVLISILRECSKTEDDILKALLEVENNAKDRHKEVMSSLSDITKKVDSLSTITNEECSKPRASKIRRLQMKEDHQQLLQKELPHFENDIKATDLLDNLICLTVEQKNDIAYDEKNYLPSKAVATLLEKLKEHKDGFDQFVRALRKAGLGSVAVILDGDSDDEKDVEVKEECNYLIHDEIRVVVDIRVTLRFIKDSQEKERQTRLEEKIITLFGNSGSSECNELRRDLEKDLPKGVYFVRIKKSDDREGGVRIVFRVAKSSALDKLWHSYREKTLENLLKTHLVSKVLEVGQYGENNQDLLLKILFQEKDYNAIRRILNEEEFSESSGDGELKSEVVGCGTSEEPKTSPEDTVVGEAMEIEHKAAVLPKLTSKILSSRSVYLDDDDYNLSRELKLRDYQKELAAPALEGKNTIICAPTNSGKTFVAMEITKKHLDAYKDRSEGKEPKVIFVVDKQNLVLQQKGRFEEYLTNYSTSDITGSDSETQYIPLELLLKDNDIVVLTAQILVNALKEKKVSFSDVTLLVFDECHHANKNHPYNQIMQAYLEMKLKGNETVKLPQVIGLTASLGVGQSSKEEKAKEHVLQMCANLDASNISTVRDNVEELTNNVTGGNVQESKMIQVHKEPNIFEKEVNKAMEEIENFIKKDSSLSPPQATDRQVESYRQWIELLENNASVTKNNNQFICAMRLRRYHEALLINSNVRIEDAICHLDDYFSRSLDQTKFTKTETWLQNMFLETKKQIKKCVQESGSPENPLLKKLLQHIKGFHAKVSEDCKAKGILFTRTRDYAFALKRWVEETKELKEILRPDVLLGGAELTQNQQEQVLQTFKEGTVNIIIATTVAEEGLDISDCNYVIRYGVKGNEISYVQSRGRIRAKEGAYVHLSDAKSKGAEHERRNQVKEHLMTLAVTEVQNIAMEELLKKIGSLQIKSLGVLKKKQEVEAMKKSQLQDSDGVTFRCKKCDAMVCHAQDIRRFKEVHHVVVNPDIYEKINIKPHKNPKTYDNIFFGKKIDCKKCGYDLGVIITVEGKELPCLKVVSLVTTLNHGKERKLFKKWKELPFNIREATLEGLMEVDP